MVLNAKRCEKRCRLHNSPDCGGGAKAQSIPTLLRGQSAGELGEPCIFYIVRPRAPFCSLIGLCTSALGNGQTMSLITGRRDERSNRQLKVWLSRGGEPMFAEPASTENVSSCGVRVRTELPWKPDTRLFVKPSNTKTWLRARVAYCQSLGKSHALGLEFYGTAHRYNLTFRCIHCGTYEASANFRSDRAESEDQLKARIYRVHCARCGWRGEACGFSALRILRYQSKETHTGEGNALFARPSVRATRRGFERVLSSSRA